MRLRLATLAIGVTTILAATLFAAEHAGNGKPKLMVLVVFDQFRGDYVERWNQLYSDDGFRRLQREGTWFANCYYPYATTMTGPGHASLSTGCSPDRHGIVTNDWYDRAAGASVYCATTDR